MKEYTVKVYENDDKEWCLNGQLHREDGPAVELSDGYKAWFLNGQLHREDGPAREWANGTKQWWLNGKLHREDGPAVECVNGDKQWWLNGKYYTEQEYKEEISKRKKSCNGKVVEIDGKKYQLTEIPS